MFETSTTEEWRASRYGTNTRVASCTYHGVADRLVVGLWRAATESIVSVSCAAILRGKRVWRVSLALRSAGTGREATTMLITHPLCRPLARVFAGGLLDPVIVGLASVVLRHQRQINDATRIFVNFILAVIELGKIFLRLQR
jgi:hypothetical protein